MHPQFVEKNNSIILGFQMTAKFVYPLQKLGNFTEDKK